MQPNNKSKSAQSLTELQGENPIRARLSKDLTSDFSSSTIRRLAFMEQGRTRE